MKNIERDRTSLNSINWQKYFKGNQLEQDCHLLALVNARCFLYNEILTRDEYLDLAERTGTMYGPLINVDLALKELKIKVKHVFCSIYSSLGHYIKVEGNVKTEVHCATYQLLPLRINVWHPKYGHHCMLAVDYNEQLQAIRVLNFKYETSTDGWMFLENLEPFVQSMCYNDNETLEKRYCNYVQYERV